MADPFFLSFLLLLFPFFISIAAQSNPANYPNCPSYTCGNISINYPFWRIADDQDQSQYCGYVGFGINCLAINDIEFPIIHIDGISYYVEKILHQYSIIILVDYDVSPIVPVRNYCRMVPSNIDFQSLPFNFTKLNVDLRFHFNCTEIPSFASEIPCLELNSGRRKSCINVMNLEPEDFDWSRYSCSGDVVKTVGNDSVPDRNRLGTEYGDILSRGFELRWRTLDGCDECEESDGRCGYNNSTGESICFCSDGRTTMDQCKTKKVGEYNKLLAKKIGQVEIVEKINTNAYRLKLPSHIRCADVFNVKHLLPYYGDYSDDEVCHTPLKRKHEA